jgi:hypothetical protein
VICSPKTGTSVRFRGVAFCVMRPFQREAQQAPASPVDRPGAFPLTPIVICSPKTGTSYSAPLAVLRRGRAAPSKN